MEKTNPSEELLNFFKALADGNRLKIVGILAQGSQTVEQIASILGVGVSTVSRHLQILSHAGLVTARADGHYFIYSLQTDELHGMARRLLQTEELPRLSQDLDMEAYDRKVLDTFLDANGRITAFPAQEKKFQVLLRYVLRDFEEGKQYSEKQVNEMLGRYSDDTASLRRGLIEYKLMAREGGGRAYWKL